MDARTLIIEQSGVISRQQLLACGLAPHDIKRLLRRRELATLRSGVYVDHTGTPSWLQQAWSALLAVSSDVGVVDVALSHDSALRIVEGPGRRDDVVRSLQVAIPHERRIGPAVGIVVHRSAHFHERVLPTARPPRVRYEEAVLDVATGIADPLEGVGVLSRAIGGHRTTAERLLRASRSRERLTERRWLEAVLTDLADGTHSVLEHGFLERVTRPHRLPDPRRQVREETAIGIVYRDAAYGAVLVELDGRLFHSSLERRDADLDRDLVAAVEGRRTVRLGWGQVFGRPCQTAALLARLLPPEASGSRPCGRSCAVVGKIRSTR